MSRSFSGQRLRAKRIEAGLSLAQLAVAIDRSPFSVQSYELGRVKPSLEALTALANALDIPVDDLFAGEAVLADVA